MSAGPAGPQHRARRQERYPEIRTSGGYRDPRIRSTGPGPGAGADQEPERSSILLARIALVMTIVTGQLWALTVGLNEWMDGNVRAAWILAGFQVLSFALALFTWRAGPQDR
jgi:hypothetical protein